VTVLCGTDFSEPGRAAILAAAAFARVLREPLQLAHAIDDAARLIAGGVHDRLLATVRERLEAEASGLAPSVAAGVRTVVLEGSAHQALAEHALAERASVLVVASQGHGASPLFRVGGTSERLALHTETPLVVVRDPAPFLAWADGERPLRIVLAIDLTPSVAAAQQWVAALRGSAPCDVVAVHLYYADEARRRLSRLRPRKPIQDAELEPLLLRDLAGFVGPLPGAGDLGFRVVAAVGRLGDHLVRAAELERADLVVVGTHHRRGPARLWSVSAAALHLATMAVATVPAVESSRRGTAPAPNSP
jgi:nucleotide-binding universal stress UspA family protein